MKKGKLYPKCDPVSRKINGVLKKIPRVGSRISRLYLWRYTMINFMIVGASGMIISFLLYEGIFRNLLVSLFGGTFLAMIITTILVFIWNYFWNRHWSLSIKSQLLSMDKGELRVLRDKADVLLASKFDEEGKRIGW